MKPILNPSIARKYATPLFVLAVLCCSPPAWSQPATQPATTPASPESFVQPVDIARLQAGYDGLTGRSRELVALYMEAAQRVVLADTDGCFPYEGGVPWRNYAERAKGAAILSAIKGPWPDDLRQRCRSEAARLVAEVAFAHEKKPNFGNPWQAGLFAGEEAMAAWFVWDDLDPAVRHAVANMIVFQADRLAAIKPKMQYRGDTQAETVAWDCALLGAAVCMMPRHPHAAKWDEAVKLYLYNTLAAPQDAKDDSPGDDGKPVNRWILGANIYEDFALENHNMFHIDYVLSCYRFHLLVAACYQAAGRPLPKAFHQHARDMYEKVCLRCMNRDGFFEYVSDNDWRRYHAWTESATVHGYLAFLEHLPIAAALEERALKNATRIWREFPAGWSYDNPYVCGKPWTPRIAEAVLLHLTASAQMPAPMPEKQVDAGLPGACELKSVHLLTQYSAAGSLRSWYAGSGHSIVRFVEPAKNSWMFLPLGINYSSIQDKKPPSEKELRSEHGPDWFWVVHTSAKGGEAFISLPDEMVIHVQAVADTDNRDSVERAIGIEKPHRAVRAWFDGGEAGWEPGRPAWNRSDKSADASARGSWINLDDAMGYVSVGEVTDAKAAWILPDPTKRSLLKRRVTLLTKTAHADALVIFPGQGHEQTAEIAKRIKLTVHAGAIGVTVGEWVVWTNLTNTPAQLDKGGPIDLAHPTELPPQTAWAARAGHHVF